MSAATPVLGRRWLRCWFAGLLLAGAAPLVRAEAPPAPANLNAHSGGDQEVALSWTASPGATSYTIFRSNTQNDTGIRQVAESITGTSYQATGLRNDLTYYFRVKAVGPGGTSGFSVEASATTLITKRSLPDGIYTLAPRNAPQLRLQATGRAEQGIAILAAKSAAPAQQWRLTGVNLTTYVLAPLSDPAQALTIGSSSTATGAAAQTVEYVVKPNQQWTLTAGPKGFRLTPAHATGLALHATGSGAGDPVTQAAADGSAAQTWIVLPLPEGGADGLPDPGTKFVPEGYRLVFGDEFEGDALDLLKWERLAPYSQPHLNDEMECYSPDAVTVKDGVCILRAEETTTYCGEKFPWRSGAITSRSTRTHGYYEARLKLPQGQGLWPAFWLTSSTRWPPEWDIVEIPNPVGTLYQYPHPTRRGTLKNVGGLAGPDSIYATADGMPNPYDGYVVYGCEVTPTRIRMWVNGKLTIEWAVTGDTIDPMWVSLNLAVGGKWPGPPDATTSRQNDMLIDYVRVYQSPAVEAEVLAVQAKKS